METEDNATAHHVPGLQPFTTYMFRVAARNALGFSKPSRESYPTMTHREREYYSYYSLSKTYGRVPTSPLYILCGRASKCDATRR